MMFQGYDVKAVDKELISDLGGHRSLLCEWASLFISELSASLKIDHHKSLKLS